MTSRMHNLHDHKQFSTVSSRKPPVELNSRNKNIAEATLISPDKKQDTLTVGLAEGTFHQFDGKENLISLWVMLLKVIKSNTVRTHNIMPVEVIEPTAQPMEWVSKWIDYSDKYGFGYQLSDGSVGVMFTDGTKLIMLSDGINVHYVDKNGDESHMTVGNYRKKYDKKMRLLFYFDMYMLQNLSPTGRFRVKDTDSTYKTPHLHQWCSSSKGVLMQLNNGTVQINFTDHTKIIMCPINGTITYVDKNKFRTFKFTSLERGGCPIGLYEKMQDACDNITILLDYLEGIQVQ